MSSSTLLAMALISWPFCTEYQPRTSAVKQEAAVEVRAKVVASAIFTDFVSREIKLYYYDDARALVRLVENSAAFVAAGKNQTSITVATARAAKVEASKKLLIAKAAQVASISELNYQKSNLLAVSASAHETTREQKARRTKLQNQLDVATEKSAVAEARVIATDDELDAIAKKIVSLRGRLDSPQEPDRAAVRKRIELLDDEEASLRKARSSQKALAGALNGSKVEIQAQLNTLPTDDGAANVEAAQTLVSDAAGDLIATTKLLSEAEADAIEKDQLVTLAQAADVDEFATNRDGAEVVTSIPSSDLMETDPLKRVMLVGMPDRRIIIRGNKADVGEAIKLIAIFDQGQAQSEVTLYSIELNTIQDGNKASKRLNDALGEIDSFVARNDLAVNAISDGIRMGVASATAFDFDDWSYGFKSLGVDLTAAQRASLCAIPGIKKLLQPDCTKLTTLGESLRILSLLGEKSRYKAIAMAVNQILKVNSISQFIPTKSDSRAKFIAWGQMSGLLNTLGANFNIDAIPSTKCEHCGVGQRCGHTGAIECFDSQVNRVRSAASGAFRSDFPARNQISEVIGVCLKYLDDPRARPAVVNMLESCSREIEARLLVAVTYMSAGCAPSGKLVIQSGSLIQTFGGVVTSEVAERVRNVVAARVEGQSISADLAGALNALFQLPQSTDSTVLQAAMRLHGRREAKHFEEQQLGGARANEHFKQVMKRINDSVRYSVTEPLVRQLHGQLQQNKSVNVGVMQTQTLLLRNRLAAQLSPSAEAEVDVGKTQNILSDASDLFSFIDASRGSGLKDIFSSAGEIKPADPQPRIFGINSGSKFVITPISDPTGQAMRFRFNYVYANLITEPNGSTDPKLPRIQSNAVNTEVQLSNFELRRVASFTTNTRLGIPTRRQGGLPVLRDIPGVDSWPLVGWFVQRNGQNAVIQQHVMFTRAVMFPTFDEVLDLVVGRRD